MTQDRVDLPAGAGATTNSGTGHSAVGSAGTQPSGTQPSGTQPSGTQPSGSQPSGTGLYGTSSGSTEAVTRPAFQFEGSDRGDRQEGRELVVAERSRRPSTAAVVGAALAGAIAGGAIPFMLAGRSQSRRDQGDSAVVEESIIVNRPARQLYDFWRDFTNFPQFMDNIESVEKLDETRSRWVIKAPAGTSIEFVSRIVDDVPGRLIAWRSEEGASVPNRGRVEFIETSSGQGTNVRTTISYDPPAGAAGRLVAKLFQREPGVQARQDLQRFKDLMEKGSS